MYLASVVFHSHHQQTMKDQLLCVLCCYTDTALELVWYEHYLSIPNDKLHDERNLHFQYCQLVLRFFTFSLKKSKLPRAVSRCSPSSVNKILQHSKNLWKNISLNVVSGRFFRRDEVEAVYLGAGLARSARQPGKRDELVVRLYKGISFRLPRLRIFTTPLIVFFGQISGYNYLR